jgi:DivIVA domain-containing protein
MDASQSALDSLRTVEFRETLKGYHRDDVDEYLEKAAVEAEGLQEQLRQSGERIRQAAERVAELEAELAAKPAAPPPAEPSVADDTLQRTLLLAQKFVDETKADAEAQATRVLAEADAKARLLTDQAQSQASQIQAESEQRLREEIARLEGSRGELSHQIESMSRHLESERQRLRSALADLLEWVDENVHPSSGQTEGEPAATPGGSGGPTVTGISETARPLSNPPNEVTQLRPSVTTQRPTTSNASLPL